MRAVFAALILPLLAAAQPTPEAFFGHRMGADRSSLEWAKVVDYFRALEKASPKVAVREIGKSTEGRPMIAAFFSSPAAVKTLDRYSAMQRRLADPRRTPPGEAEKLVAGGKAVVMITCAIHSTEVASTHTAVEFAHRMVTAADAKTRAILENVIFILVPSLNPDGTDLVTSWYRKTLGTPFEGASPPELYQKYVGHDNNRDWYIFSQVETRNVVSQLHNVWRPQIVYDVHQQGPNASRLFVPPWLDPIDPNIDPMVTQLSNMVGMTIAHDVTAAGRRGVAVNAMYDSWTPARHYQAYHAGARILSESASARLSTPIVVKPDQVTSQALGYSPRESSWNYLEPWMGGEWRLRDIVDDQLLAMESCLYTAATRRADLLKNFYTMGQRAVARTSPYAFVVPARQADADAAAKMLELLSFGMVEVERSAQPFEADGRKFDGGSYVIRMRQPYSGYAKTLLERQRYPDLRQYPGGPPKRPYDVTAHTLPLLMGVEVATIEKPFEAPLVIAQTFPFLRPRMMRPSDTGYWRKGNRPANPRVGLYRSWNPSMDEGWTRWLLEEFGFDYTSLRNADVQKGGLHERFDVIVFPDQSAETITNGYRPGTMPPEYVGGLGETGAKALADFARRGGRLVFLNRSSEYAVKALGVEARDETAGLGNREYYSPGSLLRVKLDAGSPLSRGLPPEIPIWSEQSPAWAQPGPALYVDTNVLASGWLLGEKYLANRTALLDVPFGEGRIILFGMRPQYRAQSYQTFKLFFNALAYEKR
ncbi:MAG: M14 family metallopeptidase [Bryobacteraceae bacterium]|nr:M14 family metallopeptidase [Bryobacteraceae bacterium]